MTAARRTLEETVAAIREGMQYLDATSAKADRAVKAIDDLLAIAQGQMGELEVFYEMEAEAKMLPMSIYGGLFADHLHKLIRIREDRHQKVST